MTTGAPSHLKSIEIQSFFFFYFSLGFKFCFVFSDLYETTPALTSSILDSLSELTFEASVLEDIHHSVLKTLHMVKDENLPVVIKFLLHNTTSNLAYQVTCFYFLFITIFNCLNYYYFLSFVD